MGKNYDYATFLKEFSKKQDEWFIKNFEQKTFPEAIGENFECALKTLLRAYFHFIFLNDCYLRVKNDEGVFKKLNNNDKKILNEMIEGVDLIIETIRGILEPISQGLKD